MIKIGVVGPESTGKSAISEQLAAHFNTAWAPEFARTYLTHTHGKYEFDTLDIILKGQLEYEAQALQKAQELVFLDTTPLVIKIWSQVVFGRISPAVLEACQKVHYDFLLLMYIDLPWEPDPLREHPDKRHYLFELYHQELLNGNTPFKIITGLQQERFNNALHAVAEFLKLVGKPI